MDFRLFGGSFQMYLGQKWGIEHDIHALRESYEYSGYHTTSLIDAQNAFNSIAQRSRQ